MIYQRKRFMRGKLLQKGLLKENKESNLSKLKINSNKNKKYKVKIRNNSKY